MTVRWSAEAADNLAEIYAYLELEEPSLTASTIERIHAAVDSLRVMPYRGRRGRIEGTRELVLELPYFVAYRVQNDAVHLLSIRHQARRYAQ